ncbi:MAG: NUDIX domain-containing protein [Gammaproteobacteria bacterium]|nr:NUDIX domain-containing protein [Gammaproteobacteria bacterium]
MAEKKIEILSETTPFHGFFSVKRFELRHTLYKGGWSQTINREVFHRGNCAAVLLYDPDRDEVVMIEQFRMGALQLSEEQAWLLEIVSGAIEEGETAENVAHRESLEEANCNIETLIKINEFFTSPGGTSELLTLFCGKIDTLDVGGLHGLASEDEDISVTAMKFDTAYQLLLEGKILSAIPIIALQWLYINRDSLRQQWQSPA